MPLLSRIIDDQGSNDVANTHREKPKLLFKAKYGTVTATVYGPVAGFQWTRVDYFRWVQSTTEAGKWERRFPDRETDQIHLERCVKDVRGWFKLRVL